MCMPLRGASKGGQTAFGIPRHSTTDWPKKGRLQTIEQHGRILNTRY